MAPSIAPPAVPSPVSERSLTSLLPRPIAARRWRSLLLRVAVARPGLIVSAGLAFAIAAGGCGRPFDVKTAPTFVELGDSSSTFDFRAIAPEGVVVGVRAIDVDGKGDLAFWTRAVTLQFRNTNGYGLLKATDVRSADGTPGKELLFGHDENAKPFVYRVQLFAAQGRLFVVEAGGAKEPMTHYEQSVSWMLSTVRVRCSSWLAPVLASRTCNRW